MPRNSSGVYTLPAGNPVVSGTLIESVWANQTLSDVAASVTDSLDRSGRGAMLAPLKGTDGSAVAPAYTFSSESSTGMFRGGSGQLGFSILGVQRLGLTATTITFTTPGLSITGDLNVGGFLKIGGGSAALPGLTFVGDPDTGFYWGGANNLGFSTNGLSRMLVTSDGSLQIVAPTNAAAPTIVVTAAAGGFGLDMRGRTGDNLSVLRLLSNDYTQQYASFQSDANTAILGTTGAQTLLLMTAGASRFGISPAGNVTILAPTAGIHNINGDVAFSAGIGAAGNIVAPNFYAGVSSSSAGTFGVPAGSGPNMVAWGDSSPGGGVLQFITAGVVQLSIARVPGATAHIAVQGGTTSTLLYAEGSAADISMQYSTKGLGGHSFFSHTFASPQFFIAAQAGATNYITVRGSAGGNPQMFTNTAGINVTGGIEFTSGNRPWSGATTASRSYNYWLAQGITNIGGVANNRTHEWYKGTDCILGYWITDDGGAALEWFRSTGGATVGTSSIKFLTGLADQTFQIYSAGAGLGRIGVGTQNPFAQIQVTGLGQFSAAVFDPDFSATGGTLYLADTGVNAGSGGCILFSAFANTTPGKHFASIKGFITDASGNTAGELRFNVKSTSVDTGSSQALRITPAKVLLDSRDLPLARDPGTAGAGTNPIGSIIFASTSAGTIAAFATVNAAASNLTVLNTSSSTSVVVNAGTWRNIGARDNGTGFALWIRIA